MAGEQPIIEYLFDGKPNALKLPLAHALTDWIKASRRYKAFIEANRGKVRGKIRPLPNMDRLNDLRFELEIASLLVNSPSLSVEYESYKSDAGMRSPDFTVTYKTHTRFNVEATRINAAANETPPDSSVSGEHPLAWRLIRTVCEKVGQMPPSIVNVLAITSTLTASDAEIAAILTALKLAAEQKIEPFFLSRGFESASDFMAQFRRMSAIWYRNPASAATKNIIWINAMAKHRLPDDIGKVLRGL